MKIPNLKKLMVSFAFRRMERRIHPETLSRHQEILDWAEGMGSVEVQGVDSHESGDPIQVQGNLLRAEALKLFKDRHAEGLKHLRFLIHTPPSLASPGGYSAFNNLLEGLSYLGIKCRALNWEESIESVLEEFRPTIFLSSDNHSYLSRINWDSVRKFRLENPLKIGLTASLEEYGNSPLKERLAWGKKNRIDFYFSFRSPEYVRSRAEYAPFFSEGYSVFSVEFGANPLLYFPVAGVQKDLDYVFLASNNPDKWARYVEFLPDILRGNVGFLDGPGWKFSEKWLSPKGHRFAYARARVGINLHIDDSVQWASELNERTYILAACGVPQVVDAALLLSSRFDKKSLFIAESPSDYKRLFEQALRDPLEATARALRAQKEVYSRHTSFHRAENFAESVNRLFSDKILND